MSSIIRQPFRTPSIRKQKGVAAIWFALSLVPVLGITFFAVEGTRYIHETSRLRDAAQSAALAITIDDKANQADALATKYIQDYVRDISHVDIQTVRIYEEPTEANDNTEKIQYSVQAVTTHNSWFANNLIPSFNAQEKLAGQAVAAKYPFNLGDKIIDLVLVSDFSGSMNWEWDSKVKIDLLKDAVQQISERILVPRSGETEVLNRVAIVPFNLRVQEKMQGSLYSSSQVRYKNDVRTNVSPVTYEQVDWSYWARFSERDVEDCVSSWFSCPGGWRERTAKRREARRVNDVLDRNGGNNYLEVPVYIDYANSVSDMFNDKVADPDLTFHFDSNNNNLYRDSLTSTGQNGFYTIPLTANKNTLEEMQSMKAGGGTAAYQGMLRGFQVMESGRPATGSSEDDIQQYNERLKMLIVISDGEEDPFTKILPNLVDEGMCDKARKHFETAEGYLYIGVIGVNFSASAQSGFQDCVLNPDEDIIDVTETEDFIKKIEELIQKGSRGSGVSRLYG
ncbi:pilus assembly protein [uncultured Vibrio sp.]|uniref:pilus assembly protein n=1 Tax=uncultured Vibrio sp. TaxID=114054 RepID=UPI002AA70522|nr:pilus assembly protein [uncultured Vibrio sp.]